MKKIQTDSKRVPTNMQIVRLQYDTAGPTACSEILQETPGKE